MSTATVPQQYLGIWQRTLLEHAGEQDTSTFVLWLQTELYHADIRIPADRPTFNSINHLEDCAISQLAWLASQQGFTGVTQINGNLTQWLRDYDFQPASSQRDIGEMIFETGDILVETGVDVHYLERWKKLPNSHLNLNVKQVHGENRHARKIVARLLTANRTFAYVRPRDTKLPNATSLTSAIETFKPSKETLLDWVDFEISFGEIIDDDQGRISHSTFPFREGKTIKLS